MSEPSKLKTLAWRFARWMTLTPRRWRFFFWITPRWLSKKYQMYMFRLYVERYPAEAERKMREALVQGFGAFRSEEELAARSKDALDQMLHPEAYKRRLSQIGPHR